MKRPVAMALAALGVSGAAVLSAPGAQADVGDGAGAHDRAATQGLVAQVRQAVDPYRDVDLALRHGYVPVSGCEASSAGGMGIHYLSFEVAMSPEVDPARPTILLYGPDGRGGLRLLGAEWWQPVLGQPRPYLGGRAVQRPDARARRAHADSLRPARVDPRGQPCGGLRPVEPERQLLTGRTGQSGGQG